MRLALRLAAREMRADFRRGLGGFRIFLACLALGVAAIAGIGSVTASLKAGLTANAAEMLGGDLEFRLPQQAAPPGTLAWLATKGRVSEARSLRAMVLKPDGSQPTLVSLKAVDGAYPLYGRVALAPAMPLDQALSIEAGVPGLAASPEILDRLGLRIGDRVRLGNTLFAIRATLVSEPDDTGDLFALGPPVLVSLAGLGQSGLDQPGALATHAWRLRLPPGVRPQPVLAEARSRFPAADWQAREASTAQPMLTGFIDRANTLLTLVGLGALLLGGIGVSAAVASHLGRRQGAIATLKCLGASSNLVTAVYLLEIMAMAGLGILAGLIAGTALPWLLADLAEGRLPVPLRPGLYPTPLGLAALAGVLVALASGLWSMAAIRGVSAAGLLRARLAPTPSLRSRWIALPPLAGLVLLVYAAGRAPVLTSEAIGGILGAMLAFLALGALVMRLARLLSRRLPPGTGLSLRLGLANLHRPGAATPATLLALGLGLTLLVAIALIDGNVSHLMRDSIPARAPSLFFIDIQPDQVDRFTAMVKATPGISDLASTPSLRTRIVQVNGQPVETARLDAGTRRLVDSDRGLTYSADLPVGSRVVAGAWWPADYHGAPLISLDDGLATSLGLKLGDTLTLNIAGREITARLANTRHIDWSSLGINFFMVMAPGTLEPAPQTHLATIHTASPGAADRLEARVSAAFPNVSTIHVEAALARIAALLNALALGISLMAGLLVAAGFLVLAAIVAAAADRHLGEASILKALGADRPLIARLHLVEYGLLGSAAGLLAAGLGTLGAWIMVAEVMGIAWHFMAGPVVLIPLLAVPATMLIGFAGTWRALAGRTRLQLRPS
jgi:putative ABC transport system permease protein